MVRKSNDEIIESLKEFLENVNGNYDLEKAILFGSRARGDYLNTSDVDLILVSKDFEKVPFRKRAIDILDFWNEEIDIQIISYTPREFEKMKKQLGIVSKALKEGINLK